MANQDGLRFLFDITDKITAKLAKIEAKAVTSAAKIDKAFTRASKSQETNSLKVAALEQRRVAAAQSNSAKLAAIEQRRVAAVQSSTAKLAAIEQKRVAAVQSNSTKLATIEQKREVAAQRTSERAAALLKRESDARTRFAAKTHASAQKANEKTVALLKRESDARARSTAKAIANEKKRIVAVEKTHAKAVTLLKRETDAFKRSMTRLASASAVAFAAVAGKAIQMAGGYDQAMRSVQAKTGATGALMDRLSEQSREMGRTTVHSATEAARGQAFLAQAGFDTNEILEALPATLALATAGELDLASAADIASNVLSGFRLETIETGRVTDVLAAIAARTNTSVSQMGEALSKAAPAAAAAGWSLEQTAAAIGRLSDAGIQGEEAGTVLKTMLARLAAPTGKLAELMTATGISVTDATGKMLPLNDIIAQLAPHADNTGLMFELLGTRGANAGLILGSLGDDDLTKLTAELENSEGAAQTMADTMSGGLWGAIKSIQSIVESAYISLGERLEPAVKALAKVFGKLPGPIQEVVVVVGSLAGAMGGLMVLMPQAFGALTNLPGKLIKVAGGLRKTAVAQRALNVAMRLNPIGLVITAVAALAAGIYILWNRNKKLAEGFDASAVSTEELTQQLDDLNSKIDQQTDSLDRLQATNRRASISGERRLRGLVEERDELARHVRQREITARSIAMVARRNEELAQIAADRVLAEAAAAAAAMAAAEAARVAAAARVQGEADAAQAIIAIEAAKRLAIVGQIQQRRDAELAANDARVQGEADAAQAIVDIEAAKRRAIVLQIQARRENLRDAELEAAEATDSATEANQRFALSLALIAGQVGGSYGQALNQVSAMMNAVGEDGKRTFTNLQAGVAGLGSALSTAGSEMGGYGGIAVETLGNVASALAKGDWIGAAIAALTGLGKALDRAFNGAQMAMNDLSDRVTLLFSDIVSGSLTAEEAFDRAFNWEGNESGFDRLRMLQHLWVDAGLTAEAATAWQVRYNDAVAAQNPDTMRQLLVELEEVGEAARLAGEAQEAAAKAAEEAAAKAAAAWEKSTNAAISAFRASESAGVSAYDKIFEEAIASGLGQEEAVRQATAAQLAASAEVLAARGVEYARIAAFDAAMALGANATAAERAAAAREASRVAIESWGAAMDAVTASDQAANDAMNDTWNPDSGDVVTNIKDTTTQLENEIAGLEHAVEADVGKMGDAFAEVWDPESGDVITMLEDATDGMEEAVKGTELATVVAFENMADTALFEAERMSAGVRNELDKIPTSQTIQIEYHGSRTGEHGPPDYDIPDLDDFPPRQHGGPVSAGRPYMVGERGPELFVPSRSGRIEPNGSSGGGGVDAKALAKAVADALHGTRVDVDGRQLGRLTIRHQPLAVAELGGRR